jgi:hypothetical protein
VRDLDGYWEAVERAVEASGGFLTDSYMRAQPLANVLLVEQQRLHFHDGSFLDFAMSIRGDDLTLIGYTFHYARWDGQLVWRYDNHRSGHEAEDGGRTHLHLPNDVRKPDEGTDIFAVLERIITDQTDERRHPSGS